MNGFFRLFLCGFAAIAALVWSSLARAQDAESAPEVEVNRSVLDDLDGYTPPPMFGSPEKPVLSRPLKDLTLPSLTRPEERKDASRNASPADSVNGLTPGQIEEKKRRGLSHPIIEEPPPRKAPRKTSDTKKTGKAEKKAGEAPMPEPVPPAVAARPVVPPPSAKPAAPVTVPAPVKAMPEEKPSIASELPPPPTGEKESKTPDEREKPGKKKLPPPLMPAIPPEKVEHESLEGKKDMAETGPEATEKPVAPAPKGDITAYDETADAPQEISAPIAPAEDTAKDISAQKPPVSQEESGKKPEKPAPAGDAARTSIVFDKGKSDIGAAQGEALSSKLLPVLKGYETLRVQVQSYATASDQGQSSARRISLLRALAIRAWLVGQGIDPRRIDVRALGDQGAEGGPPDRVDLVVFDPSNPP